MTREEAIAFFKDMNECTYGNLEAVEMAIKALEQEPRWIPVSERLPNTDDEVLCWYEYYHWSQGKVLPEYGLGGYFKDTKTWYGEVANGKDVRVIAWMPLPAPFEPQESEDKMGLPTDTQVCCHGCEYYNDGYCRLRKEDVKEQDFCNRWRGKEFTFDYGNDHI